MAVETHVDDDYPADRPPVVSKDAESAQAGSEAPSTDEGKEYVDHWEVILGELREEGYIVNSDILHDDAGKEVQTRCRVTIRSNDELEKLVQFIESRNYGVLPIGALTSALGAFEVNDKARLHGLKGYVGVHVPVLAQGDKTAESARLSDSEDWDPIYTKDGDFVVDKSRVPPIYFRLVEEFPNDVCSKIARQNDRPLSYLNGKVQILVSCDPSVPHRVRTWGGCNPDQVDEILNYVLDQYDEDDDRAYYSIGLDLTTKDKATVIGAVVCGSEGPRRLNAKKNLIRAKGVNGKAKSFVHDGKMAKMHVGNNGESGMLTEATFEVLRKPHRKFGMFVPLKGTEMEILERQFPIMMAALDKFRRSKWVKTSRGAKMIARIGKFMLDGFEIATLNEVKQAIVPGQKSEKMKSIWAEKMEEAGCEGALMLNGFTDVEVDEIMEFVWMLMDDEECSAEQMADALMEMAEDESTDLSQNLFMLMKRRGSVHKEGILFFEDTESFGTTQNMHIFETLREGITAGSRDRSRKNGIGKSTDVNARLLGETRAENYRAYKALWKEYARYIREMRAAGFVVTIYGHMNPGDPERNGQGGFDPHVRVYYEYKNLEQGDMTDEEFAALVAEREDLLLEKYIYMQERHAALYERLYALHGKHGICIEPGEKGIVTNKSYVLNRMRRSPEEHKEMEEVQAFIAEHGGPLMGTRSNLILPFAPPRMREGIRKFFPGKSLEEVSKLIVEWCRESHRGVEGQRMQWEMHGLLRDYLQLRATQQIFPIESQERAIAAAKLNLVNYKGGGQDLDLRGQSLDSVSDWSAVELVVTDDVGQLTDERLEGVRVVYCGDLNHPLEPGLQAFVDVAIYEGSDLGAPGNMALSIVNIEAINRAEDVKKADNPIGYAYSYLKMYEKPLSTVQTPQMESMATLAWILGGMAEAPEPSGSEAEERIAEIQSRRSLASGPSESNRQVIELAGQDVELAPEALWRAFEAKLREFLNVPEDYQVLITGASATIAMESLMASLGLEHVISLVNGNFAERFRDIAKIFLPNAQIDEVTMKRGTGPNSQPEKLAEANSMVHSGIAGAYLVTGHETSTGVSTSDESIETLNPEYLKIVDGTSEIGAVDRDLSKLDVYFGSVQKALGLPAGLNVLILSPRAMERARQVETQREPSEKAHYERLAVTLTQAERAIEAGEVPHVHSMNQLRIALNEYLSRGPVDQTRAKLRERFDKIYQFVGENLRLAHVIPEEREVDRSNVMLHFAGIGIDTPELKRQLEVMGHEGIHFEVSSGYKPEGTTNLRVLIGLNVDDITVERFLAGLETILTRCDLHPEAKASLYLSRQYHEERARLAAAKAAA